MTRMQRNHVIRKIVAGIGKTRVKCHLNERKLKEFDELFILQNHGTKIYFHGCTSINAQKDCSSTT